MRVQFEYGRVGLGEPKTAHKGLPLVLGQRYESEPALRAYHQVEKRSNHLRQPWTFKNRLKLSFMIKTVKNMGNPEETEVDEVE